MDHANEFHQLGQITMSSELCTQAEKNPEKNRYWNVWALDRTRVELPGEKYINANWLELGNGERLIATQAPLPTTCYDFWTMVWTYHIPVICMLNELIERKGQRRCSAYWPTDVPLLLMSEDPEESTFVIRCLSSTRVGSRVRTELEIEYQQEVRKVLHLQYIGWSDFDGPPLFRAQAVL